MNIAHRFIVVAALALPAAGCELITPAAGCALAEGIPLPDELKPFAPLEPVACAGLEALLAAELGKLVPPVDAGAGLGVSTAAIVSGPLPRRAVYHGGKVVGFARVAPTGSM